MEFDAEAILVPAIVFGSLVLIIWTVQFFAAKKRAEAMLTLRLAIEKGQEISPEAMHAMTSMGRHPKADLRQGIVWLAVAGAFGALAGIVATEHVEAVRPLLGVAVFPLFLGIAFLLLHVFTNKRAV